MGYEVHFDRSDDIDGQVIRSVRRARVLRALRHYRQKTLSVMLKDTEKEA